MFSSCNTLAELNAARIKAAGEGADLMTVNNEYNKRRQEILNSRVSFVRLTPIVVKPRETQQYCGVPVFGRSEEKGVIQFTKQGFLY